MHCTAILLAAGLGLAPPAPRPLALPDGAPVHLGIALRVTHTDELAALRRDLQNPSSPDFHRWLTPAEYGARFGQDPASYAAVSAWLRAQGFAVTEYPNHTFIEGFGTSGQVAKLLGVHLSRLADQPTGVHVPDGPPQLPKELAGSVQHVAGLDTRVRFHHHLTESGPYPPVLGPQDLRRFYGLAPLLDAGYVGQGQKLVVLGEAEPPASAIAPQAIAYFLGNVSDARAKVIYDALPNPQQDVDPGGGNQEFEPDVELQSVGSPGADSITLVESPASETFITGANEIVSNLSNATAVSVSLGICEQYEDPNEATAFQNYLIQGTVEGQTWSAAAGDQGADDCGDGVTVSVDFPGSLPEVVCMGGTQVTTPVFDANSAITAYQQEVVWNQEGGAGGGGFSILYATPAYQTGLGVPMRSVPDLSLLAGNPGVSTDGSDPFIGLQMAAQLTSFEGTSAASPLSAGFFALIASRVGCRLGDPHAVLYALGNAQFDGGPIVFNDITQGSVSCDGVSGPDATVGYDSASGWGSFDVAALAAAWPACPQEDGGFDFDGGIAAEAPYSQCAFIACAAGINCVTLPEGPSSCEVPCGAAAPCALGTLCTEGTIFADAGLCAPGCATNADCLGDAGLVCNACEETCVPPGAADSGVGDSCDGPDDCPTSSLCLLYDMNGDYWSGGYCTTFCDPTGTLTACGCPAGSICSNGQLTAALCLQTCPYPGSPACREGYVCQPDGDAAGTSSCQLPCSIQQGFDSCSVSATPRLACDLASGVCGGPVVPDAGAPDAGPSSADAGVDAGPVQHPADAGPGADAGQATTPSKPGGCSCGAGAGASDLSLLLGALVVCFRRRRRSC
jgi:kumamolisin